MARQKLHNDIWVDLGEDTGATDHARQMAAKFHSKGKTTLVFCSQRRIAVHQAKLLLQELDSAQQSSEQKRLADAVAQYLGLKHPLIKLISHGIAYHHSLLPPIVQRLIEHGVRHRIITTLFTTTTLREGINLPARNVSAAIAGVFFLLCVFSVVLYVGFKPAGLSQIEKEALQVRKRYGKRIAEATSQTPTEGEKTISLSSMEDLIKVADELGKPIIHQAPTKSQEPHAYYVFDGATRYQYVLTAGTKGKGTNGGKTE